MWITLKKEGFLQLGPAPFFYLYKLVLKNEEKKVFLEANLKH